MMKFLWTLMLSVLLAPWLQAAGINLYEFDEQRPEDGIYDPGGLIYGQPKINLARELVSIKESSGLDVLVAVVERLGDDDPQVLAEELANRWGNLGGRALVLCVPDHKESPWIAISGLIRSEVPRPTLEAIIAKARQRAKVDPTVHGAANRAVASLGDDLRFASARAVRSSQKPVQYAPPTAKDLLVLFIRSFQKIVIAVIVTALVIGLLIYWAVRTWRRIRISLTPKTFPDISWKPRFGAPYAGIAYSHSLKKNSFRAHDS